MILLLNMAWIVVLLLWVGVATVIVEQIGVIYGWWKNEDK